MTPERFAAWSRQRAKQQKRYKQWFMNHFKLADLPAMQARIDEAHRAFDEGTPIPDPETYVDETDPDQRVQDRAGVALNTGEMDTGRVRSQPERAALLT